MESTRTSSTWRRLLYMSFAGAALATTSALKPAEAREAPCGKFTGLKCVEIEWCVGWGASVCGTKVVSYYRSGEELPEVE